MSQLKKLEAMTAVFNAYFAKCFLIEGKLKEALNHYQVDIEDNIAQDLKYFDREIDVLLKDIANCNTAEITQSLSIFKNYKERILNYIKIGQKQNPDAVEFKNLVKFGESLDDLICVCENMIKC